MLKYIWYMILEKVNKEREIHMNNMIKTLLDIILVSVPEEIIY